MASGLCVHVCEMERASLEEKWFVLVKEAG